MKGLGSRPNVLVIVIAAFVALGVWSCSDDAVQASGEREARVQLRLTGAQLSDNVVDVVLWAPDGGIAYTFDVLGVVTTASEANFVLDISRDAVVVHTVEFALPTSDVKAAVGETGSGTKTVSIYPDELNNVTINFYWDNDYEPTSEVTVDLEFFHPPNIYDWSTAPGPGVSAGTPIIVKADVEFFGSSPLVVVQFLDVSDAPLGSPESLTYSDPVWSDTILAEGGAETLRLTASDDEGTTTSVTGFQVAP